MAALTTHLPGQETPTHYDLPYFSDISRKTAPVWLLVAMGQSGLWKNKEINQVQGVAYMDGFRNFQILKSFLENRIKKLRDLF
mgnify:CR=1 FL=1